MKIVIFSNGDVQNYTWFESFIEGFDYIICADGGIRHSNAMNIIPNLVVGDLDSAPAFLLDEYEERGVKIDRFPAEKDYTDTQIAVDRAMEMGAKEIILIGCLGDRWDHSYANVMLLYRIAKHGIIGWILDDKNILTISDSKLELCGNRGQILSLLPFGGDVYIESTTGLKYPIIEKTLYMNYPLGVSNVLIDKKVEIIIKTGWVLAILAKD